MNNYSIKQQTIQQLIHGCYLSEVRDTVVLNFVQIMINSQHSVAHRWFHSIYTLQWSCVV